MHLWDSSSYSTSYEQKQYKDRDIYKMLKSLDFNTVLDVGCARAGLLNSLHISQDHYTGFDISKVMIEQNKKDYSKANWDSGNIINLPYSDNSFDVVVCGNVLYHVDNWKQALDECLRVAKTYVVLEIRNKVGRTKYSTQEINGHTVLYTIFGNAFWKYLKQNRYFNCILHKKAFLNKKKCIEHFFPVWATTVLIKLNSKDSTTAHSNIVKRFFTGGWWIYPVILLIVIVVMCWVEAW